LRNYIIKRVAQSVLILFCVMFIIYALIRSLPSSFAETMAMQLAQAPGAKPYEEWLAQLNASYGLDLDIVPNEGRQADIRCAISDSLGFGGHNTCLVFQKWEG